MSCGAPVIASNTSAVAEVTAGAARLVDPTNKHELGQALIEVLREEGLRSELIAAGQTRASQFSWNRTAALTLQVYREAAKRSDTKNSRSEA
jgi:glycosyltransferase involved in cell wall biosynthesis